MRTVCFPWCTMWRVRYEAYMGQRRCFSWSFRWQHIRVSGHGTQWINRNSLATKRCIYRITYDYS